MKSLKILKNVFPAEHFFLIPGPSLKKKKSLQHIVHFPLAQYLVTPPPLKICCHVHHAGGIGCVHINVHINGNVQLLSMHRRLPASLVQARDFSVNGGNFLVSVKGERLIFKDSRERRAVEWFVKVETPH